MSNALVLEYRLVCLVLCFRLLHLKQQLSEASTLQPNRRKNQHGVSYSKQSQSSNVHHIEENNLKLHKGTVILAGSITAESEQLTWYQSNSLGCHLLTSHNKVIVNNTFNYFLFCLTLGVRSVRFYPVAVRMGTSHSAVALKEERTSSDEGKAKQLPG